MMESSSGIPAIQSNLYENDKIVQIQDRLDSNRLPENNSSNLAAQSLSGVDGNYLSSDAASIENPVEGKDDFAGNSILNFILGILEQIIELIKQLPEDKTNNGSPDLSDEITQTVPQLASDNPSENIEPPATLNETDTGSKDDNITITDKNQQNRIRTGSGDDILDIRGMNNKNDILMGSGDDLVYVNPESNTTSTIDGGSGDNKIVLQGSEQDYSINGNEYTDKNGNATIIDNFDDISYSNNQSTNPKAEYVKEANKYIGQNNDDGKFSKDVYDPYGWCHHFVNFVLSQHGHSIPWGYEAGPKEVYDWAAQNGKLIDKDNLDAVVPGDIIIYNADEDLYTQHIGIVDHIDSEGIHTVEGNWGDEVVKRTIPPESEEISGFVST